jgi:hypothetical protein
MQITNVRLLCRAQGVICGSFRTTGYGVHAVAMQVISHEGTRAMLYEMRVSCEPSSRAGCLAIVWGRCDLSNKNGYSTCLFRIVRTPTPENHRHTAASRSP